MALVRFHHPFTRSTDDRFRDVTDMQGQMNRLFDNLLGRGQMPGMERAWAPAVDMYETREELVIAAELPGLNQKDIHLSITGDMLTIRGERQRNQEVTEDSYYRGERWWGRFERTLPLPIPVQSGKVKAAYRDGVLTVTLPKADEIKPKEIKIDLL
jgi:HSP20 family protein